MDSPLAKPENFFLPGLALPDAAHAGMVFVPGNTFRMGSKIDDPQAYDDEKPERDVTVSPFFIGQFPVTQALWKAVMNGETPSFFPGDDRPVEQVSWDDIRTLFLPALKKITGLPLRLPTEAEWEYAARGGPYWQDGFLYAGSDKLKEVGWFEDNSHDETKPVGLKYPNQLGLYDMSGNVWEWIEENGYGDYQNNPSAGGSVWIDNPRGIRLARRVRRGGSSWLHARHCRSADRAYDQPAFRHRSLGFRLAASFQAAG